MAGLWTRWRRDRALRQRAIPDALWASTLATYPFLAALPATDAGRLRDLATVFLAEKEFSGAGGLEVDDAMAVAIAAQACLPVLELGIDGYDGFVGIVVHPDAVVAARETADDDGVVHTYDEELAGEAMDGGPVMLAWHDVAEAGRSAADGYNVVIHEFAHVLDMKLGLTTGVGEVEPTDATTERGRWQRAICEAWNDFADAVDDGVETFLDPYGATSPEEYFAVASEAFFVAPEAFEREHPVAYTLLRAVFRQDPLRR